MNVFSRLHILCFALLLLALSQAAYAAASANTTKTEGTAQITLDAPSIVQEGHLFTLAISAQANVPTVNVMWNGKTIPLALTKKGTKTHAELLLPMPYETTQNQTLVVTYEGQSIEKQIKPQIVDWPTATIKLKKEYVTPPEKVLARIKKDRAKTQAIINTITPEKYYGSLPFTRPVKGIITSPYGTKRLINGETRSVHRGLDFRGATGVTIRAIADGVIVLSEALYYSGNAIYIDHGLGLVTQYGHLSIAHVKEGDIVKAGDIIGLVGATGRVTGPHLHLTVYNLGTTSNPLPLFTSPSKK